jgi:glycosyltransferase involved in cell wall biosynthesis
LLPSYNSGPRLARTVDEVLAVWDEVRVVVDGSTDGSWQGAEELLGSARVWRMERNAGKGGAVLEGMRRLRGEGFTHALVMDADGQHPAGMVRPFMEYAQVGGVFVAGVPVFGDDAPALRVWGRLAGNFCARLETRLAGVEDSLFGFRLYPLEASIAALEETRWGRRFDFDTVLAVRLAWAGVACVNVPVPVRYPPRSEGGVTHFRYLRDNALLVAAHLRLLVEAPWRVGGVVRPPACAGASRPRPASQGTCGPRRY